MNSVNDRIEMNCSGCGACESICPKKAIEMKENNRGFLMPFVDETKCISCGLCRNICPELKKSLLNNIKEAYAGISIIDSKSSTSGGIFPLIANYILEKHGIVSGAAWNNNNGVEHIIIYDKKELPQLLQSKYVQSNLINNNIYKEIKSALLKGTLVLFSGTACQISGLKSFLMKEYDNLITVEVACHGVPSPGLFRKYIEFIEKKEKDTVLKYQFRTRDIHAGGEHFKSKVILKNGKSKYYYIWKDPYYSSFLEAKTLRKTCYHCKYKSMDRISDFTLSDFWGIEKELKNFPAYYGCSGILLNTEKAQNIFRHINSNMTFEEVEPSQIVLHNKSLTLNPKESTEDFEYQIDDDCCYIMNKIKPKFSIKRKIENKIKLIIPYKIKYKLKRINRK